MKHDESLSMTVLRITLCIIIASHGLHRLYSGGSVPFGSWLSSQGIPFGLIVAWAITLFELIGVFFLAFKKYVIYLSAVYFLIYLSGLLMVHLQHGWFVVGSGANGIEFSVLILASLFCIAYPYIPEVKAKHI